MKLKPVKMKLMLHIFLIVSSITWMTSGHAKISEKCPLPGSRDGMDQQVTIDHVRQISARIDSRRSSILLTQNGTKTDGASAKYEDNNAEGIALLSKTRLAVIGYYQTYIYQLSEDQTQIVSRWAVPGRWSKRCFFWQPVGGSGCGSRAPASYNKALNAVISGGWNQFGGQSSVLITGDEAAISPRLPTGEKIFFLWNDVAGNARFVNKHGDKFTMSPDGISPCP